jgi:hypothetical protein
MITETEIRSVKSLSAPQDHETLGWSVEFGWRNGLPSKGRFIEDIVYEWAEENITGIAVAARIRPIQTASFRFGSLEDAMLVYMKFA